LHLVLEFSDNSEVSPGAKPIPSGAESSVGKGGRYI